jgi:hypothetical protein
MNVGVPKMLPRFEVVVNKHTKAKQSRYMPWWRLGKEA